MSLSRRLLLQVAAAAVTPAIVTAQPRYPARPVRVIVPFPPGGAVDVVARPLAQKLSERLGQQFYIENIGGAGGNIGTGQAAKATPDGYTLLMPLNSYVTNPAIYAKVPYDPRRDFDPVTLAVTTPTALIVNPAVPANTIKELVNLIRANRGKYGFAHAGLGTQGHLTGEQFRMKLDLDLVSVPYSGGGPTVASVLAGHTPIGFVALAAAASNIASGQVRALAITGNARSKVLAYVPTTTEGGYPEIVGDNWVGVLVPAGTPKEITGLLYREVAQIIREPKMEEHLAALGYEPVANTPEEFAERIKAEVETWGRVIQAANIMMP
jgi:tripartite-type tricarboxylate transporter receptor subunit TctC